MARLTTYNVLIAMVVAVGTFGYGFGFGVFITAIGQPGFYTDMKLDPTSEYTANIIGAVNALFAFGAVIGSISQAWIADWIGRRKALAAAAMLSLIGAAWTAGSPYIAMLITIRIVHGIGLGMIICLVNVYLTEVSPPHCRGLMSGMTVMGFGIGYVAVAWVSVATFYATNTRLQWRLPLALSCLGPLGLLIGIPFIPESPRYLCWIGRYDTAQAVIERLHNDPDDPTNAAARAEFQQIRAQVEHDKQQDSGYIRMFTKPSWRRRSMIVIFLMSMALPIIFWSAEIWPTTIRSKGIGLAMCAYFVGFITYSTPGPVAFRNIKWGMYLIYMDLSLVCEVLVWLYVPETRGKPLEEMGALFGEDNEVVMHMTRDGKDIVEKTADVNVTELEDNNRMGARLG